MHASRTSLLQSSIGLVEDLRARAVGAGRTAESYSADYQVCLPYRGLFVWHVGGDEVVGDSNQVLFVKGGEAFHLSQAAPMAYAELIITPDLELLAEIAAADGARLARHPLFERRSRPAGLHLQHLRARLLHAAACGRADTLALEERVVQLLRASLCRPASTRATGPRTVRLVARAKEYLAAHVCRPTRLADVASAVGASPAYLTEAFRRVEGIPLHRYLVQLRLGRALVELPHANDLTTLALGLGFSSHSHFTSAFHRAFGCTPSQFRETTRKRA